LAGRNQVYSRAGNYEEMEELSLKAPSYGSDGQTDFIGWERRREGRLSAEWCLCQTRACVSFFLLLTTAMELDHMQMC
jgi:hypothetical protein